jgi:hypothetical protein
MHRESDGVYPPKLNSFNAGGDQKVEGLLKNNAPVAQLDRASDYGSEG